MPGRSVVTSTILSAILVLTACDGVIQGGRTRKSQPVMLMQMVGQTEITIVYNRPVARGRELFGGIVKHGRIWNPGADEATRISFSRDVLIDGAPLPAGSYSIWAIPDPEQWTLIFNTAHDVFHEPYPGEATDALRIALTPEPGPHMETMAFYFPFAEVDEATLHFHWGDTVLRIPIATA